MFHVSSYLEIESEIGIIVNAAGYCLRIDVQKCYLKTQYHKMDSSCIILITKRVGPASTSIRTMS